MPRALPRPCSTPGCPALSRARYCEKHAKQEDARRGSSSARGYGHAWRKLRLTILAERPLCEECEARGLVVAAKHVDHRIARARGGTDESDNLASLCASCHSRKTVQEDGGLGRKLQR